MNEGKYCYRFKFADVTIRIESDVPIAENTFHPIFNLFHTDEPSRDDIIIQRHFKMPCLNCKDLGDIIYQKGNWKVRRKESSWIYTSSSRDTEKIKKIAVFSNDYTNGSIYSNYCDEITSIEDENFNFFDMDDIFLSQVSLAYTLANKGGFFLHSSGININGKGILFVGHSGAGKSTIRNMALLKKGIKPLCNDRNIVSKGPDAYMIYGTWVYTENLQEVQAVSAPLGAIMFLEQAKENRIIPLEDKLEITKKLLPCILRPVESTDWWDKTLNIVDEITQEIPCYRLRFDLTGRIVEQLEDLFHRN